MINTSNLHEDDDTTKEIGAVNLALTNTSSCINLP